MTKFSAIFVLVSLLPFAAPRPMEKKGYNYPVPQNPLTLPPRVKTTTEKVTKELPPCPQNCDEIINIRAMEIPGKTCRELELCPENPDNIKDVPGKTCQLPCPEGYNYPTPENPLTLPPKTSTTPATPELPPCPQNCDTVNIRRDFIPGVSCIELPECSPTLEGNNIPGVTCYNPCPEGYNYPTPENPLTLPPKPLTISTTVTSTTPTTTTVTELPPCPQNCDTVNIRSDLIRGVSCKELPECPNPNQSTDINGVTCYDPCLESYNLPTPENPLTLPPRTSTTPATPSTTEEGYNYPIPKNPLKLARKLEDPPEYLGDDFQIDVNELPDFDPEAFDEAERTDLTPLTTPSTPALAPFKFQKVPILEPVLIKSCSEMKEKIPGVNCLEETEIITSPLDLQKLDSEDLKPCLDVTQDGTIEPMPGVNCILEPVLLLIPEDINGVSKPILGLDFNLATKIFSEKK